MELVEARCTACHDLERVAGIKRPRPIGPPLVANMIGRGAVATPEEAKPLRPIWRRILVASEPVETNHSFDQSRAFRQRAQSSQTRGAGDRDCRYHGSPITEAPE